MKRREYHLGTLNFQYSSALFSSMEEDDFWKTNCLSTFASRFFRLKSAKYWIAVDDHNSRVTLPWRYSEIPGSNNQKRFAVTFAFEFTLKERPIHVISPRKSYSSSISTIGKLRLHRPIYIYSFMFRYAFVHSRSYVSLVPDKYDYFRLPIRCHKYTLRLINKSACTLVPAYCIDIELRINLQGWTRCIPWKGVTVNNYSFLG